MPARLGKYSLVKTLGQGAFSKVKLAVDKETGKQYAIKIHKLSDPNFDLSAVETIENEVRAISQLSHPNIVNVDDYIPKATITKGDGT